MSFCVNAQLNISELDWGVHNSETFIEKYDVCLLLRVSSSSKGPYSRYYTGQKMIM